MLFSKKIKNKISNTFRGCNPFEENQLLSSKIIETEIKKRDKKNFK